MPNQPNPTTQAPGRGMIRAIATTHRAIWHAALESIGHFDFYHTADYHAMEEAREGGRAELIVYAEEGRLIAVPLMVREIPDAAGGDGADQLHDARSVYGYTGWLSSAETDRAMADRFGQVLGDYLRGRRIVSVFSRMHPLDPRSCEPSVGSVEGAGNTVAIPLYEGLEAYESRLAKNHRYEIRKLREKGCAVHTDRELQHLPEFVRMYSETMTRLGAKAHYYFSEDELRQLFRSGQFDAQLFVALQEGTPCAMSIVVRTGKLLQYHLSCSRDGIVRYPATKLLLDFVCREGIASGAEWFHLGGGVGGRQDSLFAFKLGFGGAILPFKTWKWIVRPADYERLAAATGAEADGFFPSYRFETP